jgi:hypothetical protein
MEMSKEAKEERNRYVREWRAKNKKKVNEYQIEYWERLARKRMAKHDIEG